MTTHTIDTLMALADAYAQADSVETLSCINDTQEDFTLAIKDRQQAKEALLTALTEALQPVRERKVISKAFCNPNQYDGEELAYNNDYLNE